MQIALIFCPIQSKSHSSGGRGRAGWGDIRRGDVSANVKQNALLLLTIKGVRAPPVELKIPDAALQPLRSDMMPLSVEACSLWFGN